MQTPDQPPEKKPEQTNPAEQPQAHNEEAIRQGLVYPPPPSFYQNIPQTPPVSLPPSPPPAAMPDAGQPGAYPMPPVPPVGGQWGPWGAQPPTQPGYPPYPQGQHYMGMQPPPFYPAPPPAKKSRAWVWALVAVGIIVLASCGVCTWAFGSVIGQVASVSTASITTVNNYYDAIQNQDYTQAYSYLQPEGSIKGLTQDQFVKAAQQADEQNGQVQRYTTVGTPAASYDSSTKSYSYTMTVDVGRVRKSSYTVQLHLIQVNGTWKIADYSQL